MRIKAAAPVITIGLIIAIFFSFTAIAVIDAPHNASNNISCGSCHGEALHYSAFWGGSFTPADIDDTPYNRICLSCHTVSSPGGGGYPQTKGPWVKTHSSLNTDNKYGDWTRECRTCHDPHYQKQKNYKNTDAGNLYLATGTITRCDYNPPVPPEVVGTSTLTYSTDPQTPFTYKSGWYPPPEDDPDKKYLTKKTSDYRRTILFTNVGKLGYNYPIIGVDEGTKTITVTGDATAYLYPPTTFAVIYGQYSKDSIDIKTNPSVSPPPASIYKTVKLFDKIGQNSFAYDESGTGVDPTPNGICQVCHSDQTNQLHRNPAHWRADGTGADHYNSKGCNPDNPEDPDYCGEKICTRCHSHTNGFAHGGGGGGTNCVNCHGTTGSHGAHVSTIACNACHDNPPHVRPGAGYSFTYDDNTNTCSNISCHGCNNATWGTTLTCLDCHSGSCGSLSSRADTKSQFNTANSHHVQGEGVAVTGTHCYQCHWEANSDGTINHIYHGGPKAPNSAVDLVIYGAATRPATYTTGPTDPTAIQYMANGTRSEIAKLNTHCISCHSDQNNTTTPFAGDSKTPKQYAWDGTSIDAKYSQTGTTKWGKYTAVTNAAQKNITKAYSAHGKAMLNGGGWNTESGVDGYIPNTRNGSENVACFDCHNSHGSSASGTTTSYTSATTNGGILKNTVEGKGGYSMNYQPQAGGSTDNKNFYNAGAGLCFDCHVTAASGTTPWGYNSTFGATQAIMGYKDTPYFGPGASNSKRRFAYKIISNNGGHFGASSAVSGSPAPTPIRGLCTPCHDPHGVTDNTNKIAAADKQYAVPLLKGTWLASPYKEDFTPSDERRGTIRTDKDREGIHYYIDQNTFGSDIKDADPPVQGIQESDTQFAGLCLNCHSKSRLTNGFNHTWKSKDRVHESVKGWKTADTTIQHNYSCSKCHTPHNSRLPRLMVTNCLDSKHKGFMGNNTSPSFHIKGSGNGEYLGGIYCYGQAPTFGWCERYSAMPHNLQGSGGGHIPGSWGGKYPDYCDAYPGYCWFNITPHYVTCHEIRTGSNTDQSWNSKTPWSEDFTPEIISGPFAFPLIPGSPGIWAIITWTTRNSDTSYVDYGFTPSYGLTTGNDYFGTDHDIYLKNLANHATYHYRVRSTDSGGNETVSGDNTFITAFPPTVPSLKYEPDTVCSEPCPVTLEWYASTNPGGGPIEYYVEVDDASDFSTPNYASGWVSGTSWTVTLPPGYWCWRVRARDGNYPEVVSDWSSSCFKTMPPPSAPTLIDEPDVVGSVPISVTLEWNAVTCPDGDPIEYSVWVYGGGNYTSGWISGTSWTVTLATAAAYNWYVQARDTVHTRIVSSWSTIDSFRVWSSNPPPAPTLIDEPDIAVISEPTSVTFEWNSVTSPDGDLVEYNVQWSTSPSFIFPAPIASGWISNTSWTTSLNSGTWYWRVQARDKNHTDATSPYSAVDSFVISLEAPPAPTLIDELDVISAVPVSATLDWNSVTCPDGHTANYYVEVDDASDFSSPNYTSGVTWLTGTSWSVTVEPDKTWYWRVQAKDSYFLHTSSVSPWSTPDSFNVIPHNPPPAPTLKAEPDIVTTEPTPVTLEWWAVTSPDGDPVEYYVEVDNAYDFSSINYSSGWITGTNWAVTLPPNYWCWRVKARDNAHTISIISSWSTTDYFNTMQLPPAPTLIDEPDIVSAVPVDVTLEWNSVTSPDGDPVEYYVQIDDMTSFVFPNYTSGWISGTSWTVTVDTAKTWYWRVQARDAVHTQTISPWSTFDSFRVLTSNPPPAPTLIHQADIRTTIPVSVTFTWNAVTDPDGDPVEYYVQVDDMTSFVLPNYTSVVWISETTNCTGGICSWTVTVNPGIRWYWRVQARDKNHTDATSAWSAIDSFNTFSADPPPAPTLIHQPDGKVNSPIILEWNSVTCPDGHTAQYNVQVSQYPDFLIANYSSGWITGTNWSVTLPTARTWYWRVQARDGVHTDAVSLWSTADSFNIYQPPSAPTLIAEPDVVSSGPVSVTLDWNSVTCPDSDPVEYYVQVDDAPDFSSPNYTTPGWISGTSWSVILPTASTWYWRVQARDSVHTVAISSWSTADSFSIFTVNPPPAPTLIDETNVSIPVPVSVTLDWNLVTCPDGDPVQYYVEIDDASNFSSPNYTSGWISGTSWTVSVESSGTWYWRVAARDAVHTDAVSPWSTADSFIIYGPPPASTLIDEPDIVSPVPVDITLQWNSVTCPDGDSAEYYVEIDDASDYSSPNYTSSWISGTSWIVSLPTATTWYWRVKARDAIHTDLISSWSTDSFVIYPLIINESFERNPDYDETGWTPSVGSGCSLNPDFSSSSIPGTPPPGAGSQCLQSISAASGCEAYATRDLGSVQTKTFTTFYVYVGAEGLGATKQKDICALSDGGVNNPVIFRLFKGSAGNLRFRLALYNDGVRTNYDSSVISLNTWYKIGIKYDNTNDTWEWQLNEAFQNDGSLGGAHGSTGHYTGIQKWNFGFITAGQAYPVTIYFDLVRVNTLTFY